MKMKSAQNDMTVGNPMKIILSFTFPIFLGNVFQQFYNMADAVIVGKYRNDHVSDLWICSWNDRRVYSSYGSEVWSR